ncbi:aldo/keto reductase [Holotrichia oblita]|uniref:Aldo/keto reductase n=1 Tax=Holotrichia oblita TaxID=644536 RepID=A0ACB9SMB9_HOLOL|nr:aldo/keto reductase [Holotrichia oblita]
MACNIFLTLQPGNVKMPALGYGTWQGKGDDLEGALNIALELGYRHIDTAQSYQNEESIGNLLKKWFDSGKLKREDIFITTKLAAVGMHPDNVEERLKESLKKLQLDYVDLYLVHFPVAFLGTIKEGTRGDTSITYLDIWKKMEEQVDAGRTKTIGVSNFNVKQVDKVLKNCRIKPANIQVEMHVYFQQKELVDFCMKNGVTIVAYAPIGTRGYNIAMDTHGLPTKVLPDLLSDTVVNRIAKKHSKAPAQILIRYLIQVGVAPIPKSVTPSRIKDNLNVFDFALDQQDMNDLRALDKGAEARICDFGWGSLNIKASCAFSILPRIRLFKQFFFQGKGDDLEGALNVALESGYRHIDTAQSYRNEEIIGKLLKKWFDSGKLKREDIFITTKLAAAGMHPDNVEERLKESLKKLQLDYVDLYLVHFPVAFLGGISENIHGDTSITYLDIWKKMEEQVDAGRTKTIGVSNFSVKQVDNVLKNCRIKPANVQVEMHVYFQQKELVDFCAKNGVTIVAYAPIGTRGYNAAMDTYGLPTKALPDLLTDAVVNRIAKKHSKAPAQILIRYLLQVGVAPIPKSVTPSRIKDNLNVFDFALDRQDMSDLRALDKGAEARICDFKGWGSLQEHPDFPF